MTREADPQRWRSDFVTAAAAANKFTDRTAECFPNPPFQPTSGSQAESEATEIADSAGVRTAQSLVGFALELAGDNVSSLSGVLTQPLEVLAVPVLARATLEACCIGLYLGTTEIDAVTRHKRSMSKRIADIRAQQLHLADVPSAALPETEALSKIEQCKTRIEYIASDAEARGYEVVRSRKGQVLGVGESFPTMTELAGTQLAARHEYRLLSSMVHGAQWAVQDLGFNVSTVSGENRAEKVAKPGLLRGWVIWSTQWFAALMWETFCYYGWDRTRLVEACEATFNELGTGDLVRFWRVPGMSVRDQFAQNWELVR